MATTNPTTIYQTELDSIVNHNSPYAMMYYKNMGIHALVKTDSYYLYKLKQKDDTWQLTTDVKMTMPNVNHVDDIDIINKYNILKKRSTTAKAMTLQSLNDLFNERFEPQNIYDLLYLYVYLHSNAVLLKYEEADLINQTYLINDLPSQKLLDDIYYLYNLIYVNINMNLINL